MPQLPFLKSGGSGPSTTSSSSSAPSSSHRPSEPPITPSPSKYHPSRLLRRRPSTKLAPAPLVLDDSHSHPHPHPPHPPLPHPHNGDSSTSDSDTAPFTASSDTYSLPPAPDPGRFYSFPRRGSDPSLSAPGGGPSSPTHATYPRRGTHHSWGIESDTDNGNNSNGVIIIDAGSHSNRLRTSLDNGRPRTPPNRHPAESHPFLAGTQRHQQQQQQQQQQSAVYPTALSPPRRPMPRSPNAQRNLSSPGKAAPPPPNPSSLRGTGPVPPRRTPITSLADPPPPRASSVDAGERSFLSTPPPFLSENSGRSNSGGRQPGATQEWLKRRPSTSRSNSSPLAPAPPIRADSDRWQEDNSSSVSASAPPSDSDVDGDIGPLAPKRTSLIGAHAHAHSTTGHHAHGGYEVSVLCLPSSASSEEEQEQEQEQEETMRWQVTIRKLAKRSSANNTVVGPTSPLNLSTASQVARAPPSASSINLSLSLDEPTGKMVFIQFPMDLGATPRRRGSHRDRDRDRDRERESAAMIPKTSALSLGEPIASGPMTPKRPVTPPPSTSENVAPALPATPLSSRRRQQEHMSPGMRRSSPLFGGSGNGGGGGGARGSSPGWGGGSPRSSSAGPHSGGTPRRMRMVSAEEVEGGLYARGTVDGFSEDLEKAEIFRQKQEQS